MSNDDTRSMGTPAEGGSPKRTASKGGAWAVPAVGIAAGLVYLVVMSLRGEPGVGFAMLGIMLAYTAVVIVLSRRSEAGALLRGTADDERQRMIGLRSIAAAGQVMLLIVLGGLVFSLATGSSAAAIWGGVAAAGGLSFIAATVAYSRWG